MLNLNHDNEMTLGLRKLLDKLPEEEQKNQLFKLQEINERHKHSVSAIESEHLFCDWGTYNCFEYALGLTDSPLYVDVKKQGVFADSKFIAYLLSNNILREHKCSNGVILYFDKKGKPKHAGVIKNNRVNSKWGTSMAYEHEIFESPLRYGDVVKYYSQIGSDTMLEHFFDYAETQGIKFKHD